MKTAVLAIAIIVICLGVNAWLPILPWFTVFIITAIAGIAAGRIGANSFLTGFIGTGLFWGLLLLIMHLRNDGLLTRRVSGMVGEITGLPMPSVILLIILALVGGLFGGCAALGGQMLTAPTDPIARMRRRRKKRGGSYKLKI